MLDQCSSAARGGGSSWVTCAWLLSLKGFVGGQRDLWLGGSAGKTLICKDAEPLLEVWALKPSFHSLDFYRMGLEEFCEACALLSSTVLHG